MDVATLPTPLGTFCIAWHDDAVVASSWTDDVDAMLARRLPHAPAWRRVADLGATTRSVAAYFSGDDVAGIGDVPVRQNLGPFLDAALTALRDVPAGSVVSYRELAKMAGNPEAVRAAGGACARNTVPLFLPCHRVVRSDGSLGGFYFGLDAKRWLLDHEATFGSGGDVAQPRVMAARSR